MRLGGASPAPDYETSPPANSMHGDKEINNLAKSCSMLDVPRLAICGLIRVTRFPCEALTAQLGPPMVKLHP